MPSLQSDPDALQSRISLSLASARTLVNSWLPPPPNTDDHDAAADELQPSPARLGLGAAVPKDRFPRSDEDLRRAVMGNRKISTPNPHGPIPAPSDSEDDVGRSAIGKKKRKNKSSGERIVLKHAAAAKVENRPPPGVSLDGLKRKSKKSKKRRKMLQQQLQAA